MQLDHIHGRNIRGLPMIGSLLSRRRLNVAAVSVFGAVFVCGADVCTSYAESPIGDREGRPSIPWRQARSMVGRTAFVTGPVSKVEKLASLHRIVFGSESPPLFSAVIFNDYRNQFDGDLTEKFLGKTLRVYGIVTTFRDEPQIQVTRADQIQIVESIPPDLATADPSALTKREVTAATFNILNLFDDADDVYHHDETTKTKPREELERVAATIRKLNADVLALQEVESRGYLQRFVEVFLSDMGYREVVHFEGNDDRGIDVCLLSRLPVGVVRSHRHLEFSDASVGTRRFERDVLAVELLPTNADPFEVWVVHLKSNYGGRPHAEPIRLAEAKIVRGLLDSRLRENPKARIILCGDFNDTWDSPTLKTIRGSGEQAMLTDAERELSAGRVTYNQEPHRTMIDFILWSPALRGQYVADSYTVTEGSVASSGADHNPVAAKFRLTD